MTSQNRTVLITGAAGQLGRAVAQHFASQGANLALVDVSQPALQEAIPPGLGAERVLTLPTNLLNREQTEQAVAAALQRFGRIDVLANIAGGFAMGDPVHTLSDDTWDTMFNLNTRTLLNTVRATVPHMLAQRSGKIVNVGAASAQKGLGEMGAYCASKSAVIRLTESMAAELREQGINVNCVLPTIIDTPANRAAMPSADPSLWVAPTDLAAVIGFLASDAARAVHGAAVPVSGLS